MMFKWLPDTKVEWRDVWLGAILTEAQIHRLTCVTVFRTIGDACDYMLALPEHRETRLHWQHAGKLLLEEVDVGKFSRQLELALFLDYQLDLAALTHEEATPLPAARLGRQGRR